MVARIIHSILNRICQWQIVVGMGAAVLTAETLFLLGAQTPYYYHLISFNFFGTLAIYQLAKSHLLEFIVQKFLRQEIVSKLVYTPLILSALCGLIALLMLFHLSSEVWLIIVISSPFIAIYLLPISPPLSLYKGLRAIPFAKNFLVGILWAFITVHVAYVAIHEDILASPDWGILAQRFFFITALTLPFDIRDTHKDREKNLATIPIWIGKKGTRVVAWICCIATFLLASIMNSYSALQLIALLVSLLLILVSVYLSSYQRNVYFYELFSEGIMSAPFLIYLMLTTLYEI